MKLQILSDLHLEFITYNWTIPQTDADVVILAGDIGVGLEGIEWAKRESIRLGKPFIYLMGNHEFYHHDFSTLYERAEDQLQHSDVVLLQNKLWTFDGWKFIGTTLWTNYLLFGTTSEVMAKITARDLMNDHKIIRSGRGLFTPDHAKVEHLKAMQFLRIELNRGGNTIVITHHAPTIRGLEPKYRQGDMLSPAFASDLEGFIFETNPKMWIFGHTHFNVNLEIGETKVVSNQMGYPHEPVENFRPDYVVEV